MNARQIAQLIPEDVRTKVLVEWLPKAKRDYANPYFRMLWETWFLYVDPDGIQKTNCPICWGNILTNWEHLAKKLAEIEKEKNLLNSLQ